MKEQDMHNRLKQEGMRKDLLNKVCQEIVEKVKSRELTDKCSVINYLHDEVSLNLKEKITAAMYLQSTIDKIHAMQAMLQMIEEA